MRDVHESTSVLITSRVAADRESCARIGIPRQLCGQKAP